MSKNETGLNLIAEESRQRSHCAEEFDKAAIFLRLSLGQTDRQVVASSGKLNLRKDLRWVENALTSFLTRTRE